jgi:hypothetical protein
MFAFPFIANEFPPLSRKEVDPDAESDTVGLHIILECRSKCLMGYLSANRRLDE